MNVNMNLTGFEAKLIIERKLGIPTDLQEIYTWDYNDIEDNDYCFFDYAVGNPI